MRKVFGVVFVGIGLVLLLMPQLEKIAYDRKQAQALTAFETLGELQTDSQRQEDVHIEENDGMELLKGVEGLLTIDKIDLRIPVYDSVSAKTLNDGVGLIDSDKQLGEQNVGIAGHRALVRGKQFNRLDELSPGDTMAVNTDEGKLEFVVTETFVVHQSDISVLDDSGKPQLTLITCTPLGALHPPDRLIIQGELKNNENETKP